MTTTETKAQYPELEAKVREAEELVETAEADYEGEQEKLSGAQREAAEIRQKLEELDRQRPALSPKAYDGDQAAILELEGLEDEVVSLKRRLRLLQDTIPTLDERLQEAKTRLEEADLAVRTREAAVRRAQIAEIRQQRDGVAAQLVALLEREDELLRESGGTDKYERRGFLAKHFGRWINERFLELRPY